MWLGVEDVAKHLGISKETVYRMILDSNMPKYRIGKLWRFHSEEIDAWVKTSPRHPKKRDSTRRRK